MKNAVLVATLVAISIRWTHGQELTWEQLAAEQYRALELQLTEKAQLDLIAAREASMTLEDKQELLIKAIAYKISPPPSPPPPNPVIAGIRRIEAARTSSGTLALTSLSSTSVGGGSQPQALMSSGGGGMQFLSLTGGGEGGVDVPPFATYGIVPLGAWNTETLSGYPWHTEANSYSTNIGMSSYGTGQPANTSSSAWAILTNHYDLNGDPQAHEMRVVYKFDNSGGDVFRIRLGSPTGTILATLPTAGLNVLTTNTFVVPRIVGTNLNVYFIVYRNAAISYSPQAHVISVQWQTYSGPSAHALTLNKVSTNQVNLSWSILNQQTNHWHLEYAGNVLGPWASNTVPVTYSNWQASVNFTNTGAQRYYRLGYHWPGYH